MYLYWQKCSNLNVYVEDAVYKLNLLTTQSPQNKSILCCYILRTLQPCLFWQKKKKSHFGFIPACIQTKKARYKALSAKSNFFHIILYVTS